MWISFNYCNPCCPTQMTPDWRFDRSYLSYRRKMLLRSSLTCNSSSVTSSLETREISSTTRCCIALHVLFSSLKDWDVNRLINRWTDRRLESWQNGRTVFSTINILPICFRKRSVLRKSAIFDSANAFFDSSWEKKSQKRFYITYYNWHGPLGHRPDPCSWHKYLSGFGPRRLSSTWASIPLVNCQFQEFCHSQLALDGLWVSWALPLKTKRHYSPLVAAQKSNTADVPCWKAFVSQWCVCVLCISLYTWCLF